MVEVTTPLLVALLFFSTLRSQVAARVLRWPLLTIPGAISYTVYLDHQYLVRILGSVYPPLSPPRACALAGFHCAVCADDRDCAAYFGRYLPAYGAAICRDEP